ncbi:hypothetical protein C7U92_22375 [Bradyrhizobium sp. WBOS7]|uniref:Uncharacterized protein n=1 Tax=Bradyrhizobium betae TaxID=244734 RepID=A0AAE9NFU0_9BRAD|nr:hypothetical protein [Bradyrhizobium sp. WBOS2]MDD1573613.1 hypothetical protein [Bradyrhizobium sp. WBOS1]MDD1579444.1 hypothetical protein [Bradyrhizobium sp. WBOS7]MDD1602109.1 hypothetical protein [Bradyrhizobium sp. WBOS16]UUO38306.1 hypothetical protein DCK84_29480 [Bradyrhizobium sp. WBOS01]UUO44473.1 hypothetical protein DCM75_29455 [Bradyrhizobium sp. WBOS02]UUO54881.1 hypothetical protein DCM79_19050 [Bradyrhizobium sp. WBOS07]UUO68882.1 hypothetical protein DCM83_29160 [Bradyrh
MRRSHPESLRGRTLDCFAALAMTWSELRRALDPELRWPSSRYCSGRGSGCDSSVGSLARSHPSVPSGYQAMLE